MTASVDTVTHSANGRQSWEDRLAGPMFFLAVLFLVVLAGLIHRYPRLNPTDLEVYLIQGGLAVLWVIFLLEAAVRFLLRDRLRPAWKALLAAVVCVLLPPLRMGFGSQVRAHHIWLPGPGWQEINNRLRNTLERVFSIPMIFFALMVLPLLAFVSLMCLAPDYVACLLARPWLLGGTAAAQVIGALWIRRIVNFDY